MIERLRKARELSGLNQRQLSLAADLSEWHVSKLERDLSTSIEHTTAAKLAGALGVTLDWLVLGNGPEPKQRTVRTAAKAAYSAYLARKEKGAA